MSVKLSKEMLIKLRKILSSVVRRRVVKIHWRFLGVYFFYFKSISQTRISSETSGDVYTNTCRYISEDYFFKQNVIFV